MKTKALTGRLFSNVKKKKIWLPILILILALIAVFIFFNSQKNDVRKTDNDTKTFANEENFLKDKADTDEGKRRYIAYILSRGSNDEARKLSEELLTKNGDINDAIMLINICVTKRFSNFTERECAKNTFSVISKKTAELDFYKAYSTAEMVEKLKENGLAANLYQQALNKYSEYQPNEEVLLMDRDQISKKIEELNK